MEKLVLTQLRGEVAKHYLPATKETNRMYGKEVIRTSMVSTQDDLYEVHIEYSQPKNLIDLGVQFWISKIKNK